MGQVATCEPGYVCICDIQSAFEVSCPTTVYVLSHCSLVFPIKYGPDLGVFQNHGHGSVCLADTKNRSPCCQIFKKLSRKHCPVFGFLSQRQDQQRSLALLVYGTGVRQISHIYEVILQTSLMDRLDYLFVSLAYELDFQ